MMMMGSPAPMMGSPAPMMGSPAPIMMGEEQHSTSSLSQPSMEGQPSSEAMDIDEGGEVGLICPPAIMQAASISTPGSRANEKNAAEGASSSSSAPTQPVAKAERRSGDKGREESSPLILVRAVLAAVVAMAQRERTEDRRRSARRGAARIW